MLSRPLPMNWFSFICYYVCRCGFSDQNIDRQRAMYRYPVMGHSRAGKVTRSRPLENNLSICSTSSFSGILWQVLHDFDLLVLHQSWSLFENFYRKSSDLLGGIGNITRPSLWWARSTTCSINLSISLVDLCRLCGVETKVTLHYIRLFFYLLSASASFSTLYKTVLAILNTKNHSVELQLCSISIMHHCFHGFNFLPDFGASLSSTSERRTESYCSMTSLWKRHSSISRTGWQASRWAPTPLP